ncbi:uncharacterized protein EI90DRAFT_961915 [Cantharellus anzutake]|uniref:uncharacterized protein n=1 Tax=Cantharellus anzutake TaxID=1750568 RepID=UPI001904EBB1|nr:uncharacterized protein EI90DRAFT_961915 [Cantharellus anzutake]KAF8331704.1 hypothetical protein EI90DRAFT_961915 [Cantharellus anzutake]
MISHLIGCLFGELEIVRIMQSDQCIWPRWQRKRELAKNRPGSRAKGSRSPFIHSPDAGQNLRDQLQMVHLLSGRGAKLWQHRGARSCSVQSRCHSRPHPYGPASRANRAKFQVRKGEECVGMVWGKKRCLMLGEVILECKQW